MEWQIQFYFAQKLEKYLEGKKTIKQSEFIKKLTELGYKDPKKTVNNLAFTKNLNIIRDVERAPQPKRGSKIYTKTQLTPETLIIESASYQIVRTIDQKVVVPYGTGSNDNDYSMLSYDVSGNYFDFDMSLLEAGYTYGFQYSFYEDSVSSYRQQPFLFKFRVEKDEY